MKEKVFPVSMAFLWGIVFTQSMHSIVLGICMGLLKLYISAHSSKESQAAYRALGCTPAEEVNEGLAAAEPFDVQMEYRL